jgi:hypothetical protein
LPTSTDFRTYLRERPVATRQLLAEVENEKAALGGQVIADRLVGGKGEGGRG